MKRQSVAGAAIVVLALGLSACTSPRDALGTNSSPCFRAVAIAKDAVGGQGVFAGVRLLSAKDFLAAVRRVEGPDFSSPLLSKSRDPVCAVNYRGSFEPVTPPTVMPPGGHGRDFAVVAVDARTGQVLGTFVLNRPPVRFSKVLA